ncbi:RBBP9/YdeN family alpha/beta hydrolase [Roseibium aestuarii]|uniref:RBBP9/YdeN family alpha/beta hydrolase n=1 Tax=Roseibium aestuarii TaxID=2600299 RepID=A0ABW4JTL4_9HYPH|nr:alpha/beta hydrolase [Roseibium aestuarii]
MEILNLPGIGNSGQDHWQSLWEAGDNRFLRFQPTSWDAPELDDWIAALDRAIGVCSAPPVLVAHSLACLLVAHWAARTRVPIAGALLVALPDPDGAAFPDAAASFRPVPAKALPFPSMVVASSNDPYGSVAYSQAQARLWGSRFLVLGDLGHINGSSGLGVWPEGLAILSVFIGSLTAQP